MSYGNYAPFYQPGYYQSPMNDIMGQMKSQYQQQQMMMQQNAQMMPQQGNTNDMIWVQGESGAKAYLIAPGSTVTLWDSENPTIYIKSADASGMPSMRILDFTERTHNAPKQSVEHVCKCGDKFVKVEDFRELQEKITALQSELDELKARPKTKTAKGDAE